MFSPFIAHAQYDPVSEPGYIVKRNGYQAEDELNWYANPLFAKAQEQTGLDFELLFTVQTGMRKYFKRQWGSAGREYEEWSFVPANGPVEPIATPAKYGGDKSQILIGIGYPRSEIELPSGKVIPTGSAFPELVCLGWGENGEFRFLDHIYQGVSLGDTWVMDMTGDGKLEVAIHWGGCSTSGLFVNTLEQDGNLIPAVLEGSDDFPGSLRDHYHEPVILDFDGDGLWEVEIHDWYQGAWSREYWCGELISFDIERSIWVLDHDLFPEYYQTQADFYRQLLSALYRASDNIEEYHLNIPDKPPEYACLVTGKYYSLDTFISEGRVGYWFFDEDDGLAAWVYSVTGCRIE